METPITIDSSPASSPPPSPPPAAKSYVPSPLKSEAKNHSFVFITSDDASVSNGGAGASARGKSADGTAKKVPRKKKTDATAEDGKPKERKPRKPQDPNKPQTSRKKQKTDEASASSGPPPVQFPGLIAQSQPNRSTNPVAGPSAQSISTQIGNNEAGNNAYRPSPSGSAIPSTTTNQPARPSSSHYDPIRGDIVPSASSYRSPSNTNTNTTPTQVRASPTLSSLMNPVQAPEPNQSPSSSRPPTSTPRAPELNGIKMEVLAQPSTQKSPPTGVVSHATPMEIDSEPKRATASKPTTSKGNSPGKAPSPKPARQKQASPPPPLGSGLLSNAAFGKAEAAPVQYAEVPNQCIVIEVPLTKPTGNYVNFMKEVEQKYGFDVAHPRLAEHRQRMKQMADAGALIKEPGDEGEDMAVDESEPDSDVDMKGADDDESAATDGRKKRKIRQRANSYDKSDAFIDDTELAWEEQALASNDGYFVWMGPLQAEGEKTTIEKAGATAKRGRGSRGGRGTTRGDGPGRGRGRGGGPGSRGGTTVRKPRITKAERERMEKEKDEREKMASTVTKPQGYAVMT